MAIVQRTMEEEAVIVLASQSFGDLRHAPVVVAVLQGTGCGFVGLVGGNVTELFVVSQSGAGFVGRSLFAIQPAPRGVSVGRSHGVFVDGLPGEFAIEAVEAFADCLGDQRVGVGADHDVGVGRVRPFRHPSAFLEVLQKGRDHAVDPLRREQGEQAVFGAERVPDRISGVAFAGVDPIVEGAVVSAVFGKDARVEQRVIESGVEAGLLAIGSAFDLETAQFFRPVGMEFRAHGIEIPVRDLAAEIRAGLIDAEERSADADFD